MFSETAVQNLFLLSALTRPLSVRTSMVGNLVVSGFSSQFQLWSSTEHKHSSVFTVQLHVMQRTLLSVRLSVCQTRALWQRNSCPHSYTT